MTSIEGVVLIPALTLFQWIIPIRLIDLIEIAIFAYVLYKLYMLMRGTIAVQIFFGVIALYLIQLIVSVADMTILKSLFGLISEVIVLAVIILFQPEIRRLLLLLGQNPLVRRLVGSHAQEQVISELIDAVMEMSRSRIGALIVFERSTGLRSYIETGTLLQARVSKDLLVAIFYSQNPLHDGAVIIRNKVIAAARCILPVSTSMRMSPHLGLRHRSAVGLTEQTDAFVVVVSEETGRVSVAMIGNLITDVSESQLREYITDALVPQSAATADLAGSPVEAASYSS